MFVVISMKHHQRKFAPLGCIWSHTTAESAVSHAEARHRFDGEIYFVLYDGQKIYSTDR